MNTEKKYKKAVYIVFGREYRALGERLNKLLGLRRYYKKMVLISLGENQCNNDNIEVSPFQNPLGVLRLIGLEKIKNKLERYLYFPSRGVLYVGKMQRELEKHIKNDIDNGIDVCLITSVPPHCVGMVGLYLKRKFPNIHWVMDWMDLWSYDENYLNRTPTLYKDRLLRLEKRMFNECDLNLTTNAYAENVIIETFKVPSKRVASINHSYDQENAPDNALELVEYGTIENLREIKIGFLGTLFKPPRVPGTKVLDAIRHVRKVGINLKLHHYGIIPQQFNDSGLNERDEIIFYGSKSYKESLVEISRCDFLLLVLADLPNSRAVMSIKLPDYFLANKPIIAIVPEPSAISDIIKKTGSGFVIPANQDWGVGLESLMREIISGADIPKRNEEEIKRYDWRNVSQEWIDIINGCEPRVGKIC